MDPSQPPRTSAVAPAPPPAPSRPRRLWALPLASAPLMWLAYHPADLGWMAYVALVPWFYFLIVETRVRRACGMTFWTWTAFFSLGMNWLRYTSGLGLFAIAAILGLEMFVFAWFARRWLSRRNDAAGWVLLGFMFVGWEYLRTYLMGGFPWFLVGHTQHAYAPIAQCADLGGVPLVGLPAALTNALLAGLLARRAAKLPAGRDLAVAFGGVAALLAALTGYGAWRLKTLPQAPALRVGVVQGNVPQDLKDQERFGKDPDAVRRLMVQTYRDHVRLSNEVAPSSDLVLWAETMFPYELTPAFPENEKALRDMAARLGRPMLVGVILKEADGRQFNSALFTDEHGRPAGRYDKRHLVMVAEYMPFKSVAPWLLHVIERMVSLKGFGELEAGERLDVMEAHGKKFGALICFDSMWPDEARSYAEQGADFLVCLSNDGWFKESEQLDQILVATSFRCIENRMGMARCTNTGISAFIGPDGRIAEFEVKGEVKSVKGSTAAMVQGRVARSLYTRWGDWFGKGCLVLAGILGLLGPGKKRVSPGPESAPGAASSSSDSPGSSQPE